MDTIERTPRRYGRGLALVGAGLVGGIVFAGLNVASAQTDPTPAPTTPATPADPAPGLRGPGRGGHGDPGGRHGGGLGMGIHGEFTTPAPNGGYQTIATQVGQVTAVSATSVTVKSEDGFSRTYAVDDNTLVNAGNEGIADVKTGDDVRVTALVVDGKASAVELKDATQVQQLNGRWRPAPPAPPAADGSTPSAPGATTPSSTGTA
jgi:hypothetical protein